MAYDEKYEYSTDEDTDEDGFISLTDDGGLQKRIILTGDDDKYMTPPKYSRIKCHYIGRLIASGETFVKSRVWGTNKKGQTVRPQPMEFRLGSNKVVRALDITIGTMKKNEICIVRCAPKYGYGDKGLSMANVSIPGNAWLEFEIELLGWYEWQCINECSDLQKHVLCNGYKPYMCKPYDSVCLSYKGYIPCVSNAIFDSKDKVTVTCDDDIRFPDGFHLALQGMEEGELSMVKILDYNLGFGAEGDVEMNIPYFADITYEIHIHHIQISKRVSEYKEFEKLEKATKYKSEGNGYFGKHLYKSAIKKYNKALEWAEYVSQSVECDQAKLKLVCDVNNNISLIWMKRGYYEKAVVYAMKVLSFDECNVKALSRCAAAKIKQNHYLSAKTDLKRAKSIDPSNAYVKKLLRIVVTNLKKEKDRQKQQYHAMFGYRPDKTKKT